MEQLEADIRSGRAADLAGTTLDAHVSIAEGLVNRAIAEKLPAGGAVKDVLVQSAAGHARATIRLARPSFLPPIPITLAIDRQPELPDSPMLALRIGMLPGIAMLVGTGLSFMKVLPPGLRLDGERLFVDMRQIARDQGFEWALPYLAAMQVEFQPGRIVLNVRVTVR